MVYKAIYKKEWFKLRWSALALCVVALSSASYFWFNLDFTFKSIEPESMMWYRFAQLEDKPYASLAPFFLFSALVIAVAQFLPEIIRNRVRILTHLPCPLRTVVAHHLIAGSLSIFSINTLMTLALITIIRRYYPDEIVLVAAKDCLFWSLLALALYLGLSAAIIERNRWRKAYKLLFPVLLSLLYFKNRYASQDLILIALILWLTLPVYDSFLSVKVQRVKSILYHLSIGAVCLLIVSVGITRYQQEYRHFVEQYYIFYSPIINDFIYQKNGQGHQFSYGTQTTTFDRQEYEHLLPFVYWKNLDIQGKLPFTLHGQQYDKQRIKAARLSLQYHPASLDTKEVALYPLFNPISHKGVIPFPEEVFAIKHDRIVVYDCETIQPEPLLTEQTNALLKQQHVQFPIDTMWGKITNMKPYDWGYFFKDNLGRLFNLKRGDNTLTVNEVLVPQQVGEIVHMQISENRQQNVYGYAINHLSQVYLISYPNYKFIPLRLDGFDYQTMTFHLISDPIQYIVRYHDDKIYHAALFNRDFQFLKSVTLDSASSQFSH
ncbi:MAG: DUF4857 domain-containing protein [Desulfuromonas sp.]|nr:DUF4857 domain-containing protein [Desulfuromonas sp.]